MLQLQKEGAMNKQVKLLIADAVINFFACVVVAVIFPILLVLSPLVNLLPAAAVICICVDLAYAAVLSKMAEKAKEKSGAGFWKYTLCSVMPAVAAALGISVFCLAEWLNRPPVSFQFDLFIAIFAAASAVILFVMYIIISKAKKPRAVK